MRTPIIAGNWKMNKTVTETVALLEEIKAKKLSENVEKVVIVPLTSAYRAHELLEGTDIKLGVQNMYFEESGAFTGEVSPLMVKDVGAEYVIVGHSERREIFGEDDALLNKKIKACIRHGLKPILACGETLEEREAGKEKDKVKGQLEQDLDGFTKEDLKDLVIAYEPIWAIGTGKTASKEDAEEMCKYIRELLSTMYDREFADATRIQYGGSVKPENVTEIMSMENIDGALVGGASLKADSFEKLINF